MIQHKIPKPHSFTQDTSEFKRNMKHVIQLNSYIVLIHVIKLNSLQNFEYNNMYTYVWFLNWKILMQNNCVCIQRNIQVQRRYLIICSYVTLIMSNVFLINCMLRQLKYYFDTQHIFNHVHQGYATYRYEVCFGFVDFVLI